ncbi:hypothetical protein EV182_000569 [Spiromyces aspiralis]|uniref:Uncharacterized protein n=1 Tax=Spiromyces aspiralis TaxID=68401 RepID=A0ACC1HKC5_9FUNG|nr:hypothetical protein EV182_000569 [Spiromyces aspiralis]
MPYHTAQGYPVFPRIQLRDGQASASASHARNGNQHRQGTSSGGGVPSVFKTITHSSPPNPAFYSGSMKGAPYDTNKWWINLVLGEGDNPVQTYPYSIKALADSSVLCWPQLGVSGNAQISSFGADWTVSGSRGELTSRAVAASDDLSVTVEWQSGNGVGMRAPLVKGMPFATYQINGITPTLKTIHAVLQVKDNGDGSVVVSLNDQSTWLITSNPAIKWTQSNNTLVGPSGYSGVVRLAHTGSNPENNLRVLQEYSGAYPTGGTAVLRAASPGSATTVTFKFDTEGSGDSLLMLALPHHIDALQGASTVNLAGYRATKGPMTGVIGATWTISESLSSIGFTGPNKIDPALRDRIAAQLKQDVASQTVMDVTDSDPYFFGKGIARLARLALIAEELGESDIQAQVLDTLRGLLDPWFKAQNSDTLVYDQSWSGIVSSKGAQDSGADFGNGWYNDHHFHYGYFAYAAAVLAKNDNNWAGSAGAQFIDTLIQDYASTQRQDSPFPYLRHFDFYDGHSWAAGIVPFADGRNQESTSEAINAYYGAYLYALATGNTQAAQLYNLILTMEARSATRYWHLTTSSAKELYLDGFNQHHAVGILWGSKADYQTFFGTNPEYIFGIQMLPFTPATNLIVHKDWVSDSWSAMESAAQSAAGNGGEGWAQFLYTAYGLIDKNTAANMVVKYKPDGGNSVTNVLYWIATCG